ncbi:MAG: hypothetical protein II882_02355 [Lachnospiraceae bacterium]|nr:hypothetical protein [Lachnospiraceae bacterium]
MSNKENTTKQTKVNDLDLAAIACGLPEGFTKTHPRVPEDGLLVTKDANGNDQPARAITADTALQVENVRNNVENLASMIYIMEQAFFNGEPNAALTGQALCHIGDSLRRIQRDLDAIVDQLFGKG